jgi:hypothetical protein
VNTVRLFRSFPLSVRLLLANQLVAHSGCYMLMPFLAGYLLTTADRVSARRNYSGADDPGRRIRTLRGRSTVITVETVTEIENGNP